VSPDLLVYFIVWLCSPHAQSTQLKRGRILSHPAAVGQPDATIQRYSRNHLGGNELSSILSASRRRCGEREECAKQWESALFPVPAYAGNALIEFDPTGTILSGANGFTGGGRNLAGACPSPGASPAAGTTSLARGTVTDLSGKSMTVASTSCDVKVTFGPTVTISKQALGTTSDLQDNQTVTVTGTRQADGSILASSIQIGSAGGARTGTGSGSTGGG